MTLTAMMTLLAGAALGYANGSNDVSKGIATLVGSGVTNYRRAILWGSVWTAAGGLLGALFAEAMLKTFGNGLLMASTPQLLSAAVATLAGAAAWVLLATRFALPVSTTHAIIGALVGAALIAYGADAVQWSVLGNKVFVPLLLTPLASLLITWGLLRFFGSRVIHSDCLCAETEPSPLLLPNGATPALSVAVRTETFHFVRGSTAACDRSHPAAARVTLRHLHWLTSGATSLARGMNDAPKIVGLALAASALGAGKGITSPMLYGAVTLAMVLGSLLAGTRVTKVLAEGVTPMNNKEGFVANLVTAALVTTGSIHGLPMSTTHVSSGGIFGAGASRGSLDVSALRSIVLAWLVTLPAAGVLAALAFVVISSLKVL